MKRFIRWGGLAFFVAAPWCWATHIPSPSPVPDSPSPSPDSPGNIFIREKAGDLKAFKTAFQGLQKDFKANGFSTYSLHRDLKDPHRLILTLKCSSLGKGLTFLESPGYKAAMKKAGVEKPVIWSGVDINPREYKKLPPKPAGIVIALNHLRSYDYWMAFYKAEHDTEHGGKNVHKGEHYHIGRHYKASNYSIHRGLGKPDTALVVHEASNLSKAPAFMNSRTMKVMQKPSGINLFEVWYGYNLEQGDF